jgi:hypothetical protein
VLCEAPIQGDRITAVHRECAIDNHPSAHIGSIDDGDGRPRVVLKGAKVDPIRGGREEGAALF